jgi:hypothetical protein
MTTIRRQSIFSLGFIYAGFLIGAFNVLYLFPKYFTPAEFGLTRLLLELSLLLSTLCTVGMVPVSIKFFPFHKKYLPDRKNDLLFVTLSITVIALIIMLVVLPWLKPLVIRKFGYRSPLFVEYFDLLYPLTIGMTLFSLYEGYAWIIRKTVVSNFLKEFLFRFLDWRFFYIRQTFFVDLSPTPAHPGLLYLQKPRIPPVGRDQSRHLKAQRENGGVRSCFFCQFHIECACQNQRQHHPGIAIDTGTH